MNKSGSIRDAESRTAANEPAMNATKLGVSDGCESSEKRGEVGGREEEMKRDRDGNMARKYWKEGTRQDDIKK
jgi:hypothetical protein